ncbi:hypothetical protein J2X69_001286 [Algoriphagus sp. 4150]|uniref:DUF4625 domain-containing protein n=1 Tax=Algoriphagus sp. 4150 TaxID=2817756 RepID=UPI0028650CCD|nr:DUF4625 domain-containing protein [Algoriphagus sp. 4150]MDR7128951.1 hypothetical protein [Algoriphagus sp. 4150]
MQNLSIKLKPNSIAGMPFLLICLFIVSLFSCKDDEVDPVQVVPTLDKVEVGLNNNEMGVIGRDFHFNAEVLAGDRIETVQIRILQRSEETYSETWSHEVVWEEYRGVKNATIHKHFDIPADAVEGTYDFLIIVTDQNGTILEDKRAITIYTPENLPLDLGFNFGVEVVDANFKSIKTLYALSTIYEDFEPYKSDEAINKNEFLAPIAGIASIKGDGKMYCLLIDKKHNHRPETISDIDFSKVIVADVWEHEDLVQSEYGSNMYDFSTKPLTIIHPMIEIGAASDNNTPAVQPITGQKAWASGNYYVGFIYENSTYNMSLFHYGDVSIKMD